MAVAAILVGSALMAYGQIREGQMAAAEGKMKRKISDYNAEQLRRQAIIKREAAALEESRITREEKSFLGKKIAKMAMGGMSVNDVSSLEVLSDDVYQFSMDRNLVLRNGLYESISLGQQAKIQNITGRFYEKAGKYARNVSYIKAGSTLLSGVYLAGQAATVPPPAANTGSFVGNASKANQKLMKNAWAGTNTSPVELFA